MKEIRPPGDSYGKQKSPRISKDRVHRWPGTDLAGILYRLLTPWKYSGKSREMIEEIVVRVVSVGMALVKEVLLRRYYCGTSLTFIIEVSPES
jgi:hypothetical protein